MKLGTKRIQLALAAAIGLLILAGVAVVYLLDSPPSSGMCCPGSPGLVLLSGTLTQPNTSAPANLVINIKNSANNPITSVTVLPEGNITVTTGGESFGPGQTYTLYSGNLPVGQQVSGTATIGTGVVPGDYYSFTITILFSGETGSEIQTLTLTAQA